MLDVTEVDSNPKGRFVSFKVAPSSDRVVCVYAPSGHGNREQLAKGRFFEALENYMENKFQGNENKIIIGDFNCTLDKMERDEGNKTQKRYRCHSNFALSKLIMEWRIYGGGRTRIFLSSPAMIDPQAQDPGLTGFTLI